jgi:hypothetical protein
VQRAAAADLQRHDGHLAKQQLGMPGERNVSNYDRYVRRHMRTEPGRVRRKRPPDVRQRSVGRGYGMLGGDALLQQRRVRHLFELLGARVRRAARWGLG